MAVIVFFLAAGIYFLLGSTRESKRLEQNLIDRFGWAGEYTPSIEGNLSQQRMQAFIRVRQAVQPSCSDYQDVLNGIIGLTEIETDAELSGEEKASRGLGGIKSMIGVGPKLIQFMDARNGTLLTEEMGLGEYMYIYLAVYGQHLAKASGSPYADMEEAYISTRTRDEYVQILKNQVAALAKADSNAGMQNLSAQLGLEIQALEDGSHPSPWPDGPPAKTFESLAPFQEQLSDLYCEGIVAIELLQKNRGLGFRG
jgi:hypothetical protein